MNSCFLQYSNLSRPSSAEGGYSITPFFQFFLSSVIQRPEPMDFLDHIGNGLHV
jgi:hypothetical protein